MSTAILEYYPVVLSTAHWAQTCILQYCSPSAAYLHWEQCIHTRVSMPTLKTCNQFSSIPAHSPALCQTKLYSGLRHRRTKTPLLCTTQSTTLSDTGHRTDDLKYRIASVELVHICPQYGNFEGQELEFNYTLRILALHVVGSHAPPLDRRATAACSARSWYMH